MLIIYILMVINFVVLLFSKLLYSLFSINIMSSWSPAIPYILFMFLLALVLFKYKLRFTKDRDYIRNRIFFDTLLLSFCLFLSCIGWYVIGGEGFYIYDFDRDVYYLNDKAIIIQTSDFNDDLENVFGGVGDVRNIYVGKPLFLGFITVEKHINEIDDKVMFDMYYNKVNK